jgi:hypothetical protein
MYAAAEMWTGFTGIQAVYLVLLETRGGPGQATVKEDRGHTQELNLVCVHNLFRTRYQTVVEYADILLSLKGTVSPDIGLNFSVYKI